MNDKYKGEKVLVVENYELKQRGVGEGLIAPLPEYLKLESIFGDNIVSFMDRNNAEKDENFKQIIPYVIFRCGNKVFSYVRGKGTAEQRLKGNRSIGVGGHINPKDVNDSEPMTYKAFRAAMLREIDEEVDLVKATSPKLIAFINDNSNPVGRVHFGVVHLCDVKNESDICRREEQISQSGFFPITEMNRHSVGQIGGGMRAELENWSLLCVDNLLT